MAVNVSWTISLAIDFLMAINYLYLRFLKIEWNTSLHASEFSK